MNPKRHKSQVVVPLTAEKYEQLRQDFRKFKKLQEEILVRLQSAREMGDLSENGAYKYAKFELGNVRRKLREIRYLLKHGEVQEKASASEAGFGNKVKLVNGDRELVFTLVSQHESNPGAGKLSTESPIGKAVLGKKAGEEVIVELPDGRVKYRLDVVE